jgi:NAD(P) transhydrogenase subunit beta
MIPTWAQLVYLACAVAFILALKGLSGPRTARTGNLIGAGAAVVACALPFFYLEQMDNVVPILVAIAIGAVGGVYGARTVQMTQMPQMVALFNGVGGGAAALVALLELDELVSTGHDVGWFVLVATAFTIFVGSVSFAGSVITFAKLQDLMTSRPVVFPGLPLVFAGALLGGLVVSGVLVADPVMWSPDSVGFGPADASIWRIARS